MQDSIELIFDTFFGLIIWDIFKYLHYFCLNCDCLLMWDSWVPLIIFPSTRRCGAYRRPACCSSRPCFPPRDPPTPNPFTTCANNRSIAHLNLLSGSNFNQLQHLFFRSFCTSSNSKRQQSSALCSLRRRWESWTTGHRCPVIFQRSFFLIMARRQPTAKPVPPTYPQRRPKTQTPTLPPCRQSGMLLSESLSRAQPWTLGRRWSVRYYQQDSALPAYAMIQRICTHSISHFWSWFWHSADVGPISRAWLGRLWLHSSTSRTRPPRHRRLFLKPNWIPAGSSAALSPQQHLSH